MRQFVDTVWISDERTITLIYLQAIDIALAVALSYLMGWSWWAVFLALNAMNIVAWSTFQLAKRLALATVIAPRVESSAVPVLKAVPHVPASTATGSPDWFLKGVAEDARNPDEIRLAAAYQLGANGWNPTIRQAFDRAWGKFRADWSPPEP